MPAVSFYAKSLAELLANRVRDQPDRPAIYTSAPGNVGEKILQALTYSQVQKAADRLAWHYSELGLMPKTVPGSLPPTRNIAVFTSSAIDESLLEIALTKLGLTGLLLSVNNSVPAVAHLIKITNATHLIYGAKFVQEANQAQAILRDQGYTLDLIEDKRFALWGVGGVDDMAIKPYPMLLTPEQEKDRPAVILHSSGSTGFPKPVNVSHYGLIANAALNQNMPAFSTLPVYHGYGHYAVFRCLYSGQPLTLFPPHLPLTSANICSVLAASPPVRQCFAVPYVIKLLGETPEGVEALASFDIVGFAGAALPDDLGDRLVAAGVNLLSIYGITETGTIMNSNRDYSTDKGWNWLRPFGLSVDYLFVEPRGDNTFEAIVKDGYPSKIETNRPDGSFATKDLFLCHPEHDNWYKYIGRLDDTLVQILGEKTNPVPIELCIRGNSPYVAEAIVFGDGRPQTGCLILRSELGKDLLPAQMMEKVWPVIEQANSEAPTHSRLLPEMVEFLPYGTHIPVATKMSILRPACYAKFKDLIDKIYERFEQGSEVEKVMLSPPELEKLIYDTIAKVMGPSKATKLTNTVDLFAFGVDSLQGTRIRNTLQKSLELHGKTMGQNVVYEHPSIEKLASYILALQSNSDSDKSNEQQQEAMLAMVDKWSAKFETHRPSSKVSTSDHTHVIVLTGATGSLGAHILSQLTASRSVRKVICLSRASSHEDSLRRMKKSLELRKATISDKSKIESYAADTNADLLGLSQQEYDHIRNEVTIVIHNAWPVNFVLSIESYDEHVGGALNLINLCLKSPHARPAAFYFSSSISSRQGVPDATCTEDFSPSPSTAAGTGYARSKWVVEKLCQRAAQQTGVKVGVLRIGQMVGDSINGVWNETEAWPLMFKGANTVGALPRVNERPSWLPVDYAGRAISEVVLRQDPPQSIVYHIVNPDVSTSWNDILVGLREAGLKFETVDPTEWLERLAASDKDPHRNPVIKLLSYFQNRYNNAGRKPMVFLTDETAKAAPSIRDSPPVSRALVRKWVEHWREVGFLA